MLDFRSTISTFENGEVLEYSYMNDSRHIVNVIRKDKSECSYCFSVPVLDLQNASPIFPDFRKANGILSLIGTNGNVFINNDILFENRYGQCRLFCDRPLKDTATFVPTLNGLFFTAECFKNSPLIFNLRYNNLELGRNCNGRTFSIMRGDFVPFFTIAGVSTLDWEKKPLSPPEITCQMLRQGEILVSILPTHPNGRYLCFEMNLYEEKLFSDTTVESKHSQKSNPYGSVAYVGCTDYCGKQWFYSRPDFSKISPLIGKAIKRVNMYIPLLYCKGELPEVTVPHSRFCSFGANWDNKIASKNTTCPVWKEKNYLVLDVTSVFVNPITNEFAYNEGIIIRPPKEKNSLCIFYTGDSFYHPQFIKVCN